jgi:transcriptional regulator with XRE-family HTH domain
MPLNGELAPSLARLIGVRLRETRTQRQVTQVRLAEELGVSRTTLSNIECGRQRLFVDQVYQAALHLAVPVAQLLPDAQEVVQPRRVRTAAEGALPPVEQARLSRAVDDALERASGVQVRAVRAGVTKRATKSNRDK